MVPYRLLAPVFFNDPQPQRTALELEEHLLSVPDKYSDHESFRALCLCRAHSNFPPSKNLILLPSQRIV